MQGQYAIEARSLNIGGLWSHNFWVLRHPNGDVMAELHGLATDRVTHQPVAIGTSAKHSLRAWHYVVEGHVGEVGIPDARIVRSGPYYRDGQYSSVVMSGDGAAIMPRWRTAAKSLNFINSMDIDYPPGGVKIFGRTKNSNSMFTSLGDLMGLPRFSFWQVFEPGISNPVLVADLVEGLQGMSGEVWDSGFQFAPPNPAPSTAHPPTGASPSTIAPGGGHFAAGTAPASPDHPFHGRVTIPFMEYTDEFGVVRRFLAE